MARLAGKVAFITGGGGGIGRATAERFAEEGAKVVIAEIDVGRGEAAAQAARSRASNSGGDAYFIHCDIRERANVEAAFAETVRRFGGLHILHNNAGGSSPDDGRVTEVSEDEFWRVIKLDVYGTFLCSRLGIPHMIKSGGGSIINMSSIVALRALPGRDCYTAAKGAVAAMTRSMAVEYAADKIRVNAIAPGVVLTERVKKLLEGSKDIEKLAATHLLGLGLPIHMADMAVYLASDESAITTGQVISVDSGATIR
jgi:NAD(P)-dependent dehydrogenase (short-subunit alcohol dehydrogenase family)